MQVAMKMAMYNGKGKGSGRAIVGSGKTEPMQKSRKWTEVVPHFCFYYFPFPLHPAENSFTLFFFISSTPYQCSYFFAAVAHCTGPALVLSFSSTPSTCPLHLLLFHTAHFRPSCQPHLTLLFRLLAFFIAIFSH